MKKPFLTFLAVVVLLLVLCALFGYAILNTVDPDVQIAENRDSQRISDLNHIANAIRSYSLNHNTPPETLAGITPCELSSKEIGTTPVNVNLKTLLVPEYMGKIPRDPDIGTTENSGYYICINENEKVQLSAPTASINLDVEV